MNLTDKYVDRNRKILEDALHGEAFSHIARINNLTSERIRQIVQEYSGFTSKDLRATEKKYKRTLNMEYKNLLDVLQASIVLKRALCDVVLSHLEQVFHHGREKLTPYEKIQFAGLWNRGVSSDKIKETLHLVSSPSYYARKLGLKRRPSCITFSVNYSLLEKLV